jgi:membrane protease YdiL (CAAX protease family)
MTTTTTTLPQDAARSARDPLRGAAWFVAITIGFSALASVAVIASGAQPTLLAFALAISPTVIACALAWRDGHGAVRGLLRQLAVRPANPVWYLTLLIPVVSYLAVDAIAVALGTPAAGLFDDVFPAVLIVPLVVFLPAFAEEIGWRGYALPRTLSAMSPLRAAIVLGIPWALIHVPLSWPGQMNSDIAVWSTVTQVISYSVILTWVYVGTGGSVLMTGLFHTLLNGLVPLTNGVDPLLAWDIRGVLFPIVAVVLVALGGFRARQPAAARPAAAGLQGPAA